LRIGVPTETAPGERRVALVPDIVRKLTQQGHEVVIEAGAGESAGLPDALFIEAGATTGDPYGADGRPQGGHAERRSEAGRLRRGPC
jgi:NAD(P) transhydrogenase subunit alpha